MLIEEKIKTSYSECFIDVTNVIESAIKRFGLKSGHILVSVPHTTAALTVNENADPSVVSDILRRLDDIIPATDSQDRHSEGNSHAHLKSSLLGSCHAFIVENSQLVLGTWQGVYLCEFDGPRTRRLIISA